MPVVDALHPLAMTWQETDAYPFGSEAERAAVLEDLRLRALEERWSVESVAISTADGQVVEIVE